MIKSKPISGCISDQSFSIKSAEVLMNDLVKPQCIGGALRHAAEVHQSAVAYIDRGDRYSFRQVDTTTDHIASGLLALGLSRGDRLLLWDSTKSNGCSCSTPQHVSVLP